MSSRPRSNTRESPGNNLRQNDISKSGISKLSFLIIHTGIRKILKNSNVTKSPNFGKKPFSDPPSETPSV